MTVKVSSIGLKGLEGYRVQVEVRIRTGTEPMVIVGMPDASVKESRERVAENLEGQEMLPLLTNLPSNGTMLLFTNPPLKDFPFEVISQTSPLTSDQHKMLMNVAVKTEL
ncbi:hypothetical protein QF028_005943 [Neobacillus sp. B4I6]